MSLFLIALRSIQQRGVASLLTMLSMALGVMLVVAVLSIHGVVAESFRNNASLGYNLILGAKGGREQLVLNTVYYLSQPVENVPYTFYLEFLKQADRDRLQQESFAARAAEAWRETAELQTLAGGGPAGGVLTAALAPLEQSLVPDTTIKGHPPVELKSRHGKYGQMIELAIPVCLGDYYGRFRVVGTTPTLFDDLVYDVERNRKFEFAQGRNFQWRSEENGYFEAVIGAQVAREIRLTVLELDVGPAVDEARTLVAEQVNWSRIEIRGQTVVVTLGQGTTDTDLTLALNKLNDDVADGKTVLTTAQQQALDAVMKAIATARKSSRPLAPGDAISPAHGEPGGHLHQRKFTIVGILAPSGTPNDRAVFINMEGFYLMEDHAKPLAAPQPDEAESKGSLSDADWQAQTKAANKRRLEVERAADPEPLPAEQREVTSILLKCDVMFAPGIEGAINEGQIAQAVLPVAVITGLFEFFVGPINRVLLGLTFMICVVSAISILVSIYNSM